ncbi:MAG: 1-phosphofructokinase family hexose kinase [Candidatus Omnitrophota bacterium]|nr:MAG: 1-phosphofructokinase family hexose kinase [Candidatus Omnitrophota bacterium]
MKPTILTITLNPAIDKTVFVPHFKIGKDFREKKLYLSAGGKGINVSRVLKRLKETSIASGFLGGGDGTYMQKQLGKERIKHDFCEIKNNTRTSLTILDPMQNTITRVLERGPQITKKELNNFRKKFSSLLRYCRYVIFSGRNIPGAPDSFYGELIALAKKKNIFTVLDTSGRALALALKEKPFMIKPNLKEIEQIAGKRLSSFSQMKQAVYRLKNCGIQIIALTLGSRGTIVFDGKEMIVAAPPKVERRSPVGCGDAFIGGFVAAHAHKENLKECVRIAVACGAANALSVNPGFINLKDIKTLYRQVTLRSTKF